jgi:Rrf2 family protein
MPANYLSKILHALARAGVLESERGPNGGFRLARSPEELSLAEVMAPFEAIVEQRSCLLGRDQCSDEAPCRLHEHWKLASDPMIEFFKNTKIADLIGQTDLCT